MLYDDIGWIFSHNKGKRFEIVFVLFKWDYARMQMKYDD